MKRYTHEEPNIQRVIYTERLTERGYTHERTNILREIHTEGHIHGGDIYIKE